MKHSQKARLHWLNKQLRAAIDVDCTRRITDDMAALIASFGNTAPACQEASAALAKFAAQVRSLAAAEAIRARRLSIWAVSRAVR